jgi:hypothetical protein
VFIETAKYAAEQRNYYWEYGRQTRGDAGIVRAKDIKPYPLKKDKISDQAVSDSGGNFGRLARYGVMNEYVQQMMATSVRGVSAAEWLTFFKKHARGDTFPTAT